MAAAFPSETVTRRVNLALAASLLREDLSMAEVARVVGVTRERIRQLVGKGVLPRPRRRLYKAGASLKGLVDGGYLRPDARGFVTKDQIEQARARLSARPCLWPSCTNVVGRPWVRVRYCPEHSTSAERYRYPVMDQRQRAAAQADSRAWAESHPARARVIRRRAGLVYRLVVRGMDRAEARRIALERHPLVVA